MIDIVFLLDETKKPVGVVSATDVMRLIMSDWAVKAPAVPKREKKEEE